jgi:hypothetical protein
VSAQDLRAAAETHRELGPDYSDAVVDSFFEKIEARLDDRVNARLAELKPPPSKGPLARLSAAGRRNLQSGIAIGAGGIGTPLSLMMYNTIYHDTGHGSAFWGALLIASAGSCGAGLARAIRRGR